MAGTLTLALIKPHIHMERKAGEIIKKIEENKFAILLCKLIQLRDEGIAEFYGEHKDKDFFPRLKKSMLKGPTWVLVLAKENAVEEWRNLIGHTNPNDAPAGTLRNIFGDPVNPADNAVHGSSDDWAAKREINFFFGREINIAAAIEREENKVSRS